MTQPRILDRIRKLLELAHSDNEHEAAQAASRASALMAENQISEAMLEVVKPTDEQTPHIAERIVEHGLDDEHRSKQRVAWRDRIVSALAMSLNCEAFYDSHGNLIAFGRESAVQSWKYIGSYLINEVDRLADKAWLDNGADLAAVGTLLRPWKSAFRLGAADVIHERMYADYYARKERENAAAKASAKLLAAAQSEAVNEPLALVRVTSALEIVEKDRNEVKAKFKARTKGFRAMSRIGNSTRGRSGYKTGRDAGATVNITGGGKALKRGS